MCPAPKTNRRNCGRTKSSFQPNVWAGSGHGTRRHRGMHRALYSIKMTGLAQSEAYWTRAIEWQREREREKNSQRLVVEWFTAPSKWIWMGGPFVRRLPSEMQQVASLSDAIVLRRTDDLRQLNQITRINWAVECIGSPFTPLPDRLTANGRWPLQLHLIRQTHSVANGRLFVGRSVTIICWRLTPHPTEA